MPPESAPSDARSAASTIGLDAPPARASKPREPRRSVELPAVAIMDDGTAVSVTLLDLSYDGCRISSPFVLSPGQTFTLSVLGLGKMPAFVRWYGHGLAGLCFSPKAIEGPSKKARISGRASLVAKILVRRAGRRNHSVLATDLSPSGCRIEFVDRPTLYERHWIKFEGMEAIEGEVRWIEGFTVGLEFVRPIYPAVYELILARAGDR